MMLGIYYATLFLFYGSTVAALIVNIETWPIVAGIYGVRLISQEIVFYLAGKKLKSTSLLFALPLLDLLYVFYLLIFGTKGLFTKNRKEW